MFTTIWIQVMATKVYTSAEFKRERDNFLSLIKNMEKADTKKWLDEVKETLFRSKEWTRDYDVLVKLNSRDRAGDERKDEYSRLEAVIEKHQGLIPRVLETQVKSEVSAEFSLSTNTNVAAANKLKCSSAK